MYYDDVELQKTKRASFTNQLIIKYCLNNKFNETKAFSF